MLFRSIEFREKALVEFDEHIWMVTIEKVTVMPDNKPAFQFKDGTEIKNLLLSKSGCRAGITIILIGVSL